MGDNLVPTIECYGSYKHSNYGSHAMVIEIPGVVTIWYSYTTPIAFYVPGGERVFRANDWGSTTGSHMSMVGGNRWERDCLSSEAFVKALEAAMLGKYREFKWYKWTLVEDTRVCGEPDDGRRLGIVSVSIGDFEKIRKVGGILFDGEEEACKAARKEDGRRTRGKFSRSKIRRQKIYIVPKQPGTDRSLIL